MQIERWLDTGIHYLQNHPLVVLLLFVGLIIVSTVKAKGIFKFVVFAIIIGVILYIISQLGETTSTALKNKDDMIYQTRKKDF
jgi:lipopolysaccharide export LptBFGC system permease protein LptF